MGHLIRAWINAYLKSWDPGKGQYWLLLLGIAFGVFVLVFYVPLFLLNIFGMAVQEYFIIILLSIGVICSFLVMAWFAYYLQVHGWL